MSRTLSSTTRVASNTPSQGTRVLPESANAAAIIAGFSRVSSVGAIPQSPRAPFVGAVQSVARAAVPAGSVSRLSPGQPAVQTLRPTARPQAQQLAGYPQPLKVASGSPAVATGGTIRWIVKSSAAALTVQQQRVNPAAAFGAEKVELETQLAKLKEDINLLEALRSQEKLQLEKLLQTGGAEKAEVETQLAKQHEAVRLLRGQVEEALESNRRLTEDRAKLIAESGAERAELEAQITKQQNDIQLLKSQVEEALESNRRLAEDRAKLVAESGAEKVELETQLAKQLKEIQLLKGQVEEALQSNSQLEEDGVKLAAENQQLVGRLRSFRQLVQDEIKLAGPGVPPAAPAHTATAEGFKQLKTSLSLQHLVSVLSGGSAEMIKQTPRGFGRASSPDVQLGCLAGLAAAGVCASCAL